MMSESKKMLLAMKLRQLEMERIERENNKIFNKLDKKLQKFLKIIRKNVLTLNQ